VPVDYHSDLSHDLIASNGDDHMMARLGEIGGEPFRIDRRIEDLIRDAAEDGGIRRGQPSGLNRLNLHAMAPWVSSREIRPACECTPFRFASLTPVPEDLEPQADSHLQNDCAVGRAEHALAPGSAAAMAAGARQPFG
jgi:hypothetical protein